MDDNKVSVLKFFTGVLGAVVIAWLIWVSNASVANSKDIAVMQANYITIKESVEEIKCLTKEIRQDQVRRQKKEREY